MSVCSVKCELELFKFKIRKVCFRGLNIVSLSWSNVNYKKHEIADTSYKYANTKYFSYLFYSSKCSEIRDEVLRIYYHMNCQFFFPVFIDLSDKLKLLINRSYEQG